LAPATTAPLGSVSVPWMLPVAVVLCANSGPLIQKMKAALMTIGISLSRGIRRCAIMSRSRSVNWRLAWHWHPVQRQVKSLFRSSSANAVPQATAIVTECESRNALGRNRRFSGGRRGGPQIRGPQPRARVPSTDERAWRTSRKLESVVQRKIGKALWALLSSSTVARYRRWIRRKYRAGTHVIA